MGISKRDFFHMTPKDFQYHIDAYEENIKHKVDLERSRLENAEYISWLDGLYVLMAVGSVLGGKKAKRYPEKPITDHSEDIAVIAEKNGKTEEEINQELLLATLRINEANARIGQLTSKGQSDA